MNKVIIFIPIIFLSACTPICHQPSINHATISAYDYYENAPYADDFGIPPKYEVDIEEVEESEENILQETEVSVETEIQETETKEIEETTIYQETTIQKETTSIEEKHNTITFSPIKNPRRTLSDLSVSVKDATISIISMIKKGEHKTLNTSLDTAEEAIKAVEEIYYPYTYGGSGLHAQETPNGIFITFHAHANELLEKNDYVSKKIRQVAHMIMVKGMREDVAIRRLNDWIIHAVDYDKGTNDLYSLFYHHKGNCVSFSNIFEQFCDYVGIECMSIVGEAGEGHEWNKVRVDGKWYYIDVTFNQSTDGKYYLSEKLWDDHKILLEYKSTFPEN